MNRERRPSRAECRRTRSLTSHWAIASCTAFGPNLVPTRRDRVTSRPGQRTGKSDSAGASSERAVSLWLPRSAGSRTPSGEARTLRRPFRTPRIADATKAGTCSNSIQASLIEVLCRCERARSALRPTRVASRTPRVASRTPRVASRTSCAPARTALGRRSIRLRGALSR